MKNRVIVIGGGPAGLMAAIAAAEAGGHVTILDKGKRLGQKLAISGGGRCNVTNAMPVDELIQHLPGNGKFLYSALSQFNNEDIRWYFEGLGIPLKEEDHGRLFPVSDSAKTVVNALLGELKRLGVEMWTETRVSRVDFSETGGKLIMLESGEVIETERLIIATGGKSVPKTGSTGDGYPWAEAAGHTITTLYPTEVPLTSEEDFIKARTLQGLSLSDVALTAWNPKKKPIKTHRWDMLFTHMGISGPAALRLSQYIVKALKKFDAHYIPVTIDVFPDLTEDELVKQLTEEAAEHPDKAIRNVWKKFVPERYLVFLLERLEIDSQLNFHQLSKQNIRVFAHELKFFEVKINGTLSLEKAFITGGGVSLKEVNAKTLESKKVPGLYFCGEILDIHGYTGGYNITAAFTTGHAAGTNAAE